MTRRRWGISLDDRGSAIVEFVFIALVVLVPLVYFVVAVAVVQRSQLAVGQAAREVGRAFATASSRSEVPRRVTAALRIALRSHGLTGSADVRLVAAGAPCTSAAVDVRLDPGAEFTVCVTRRTTLPAVPSWVTGRSVACVGRFTVHVDDYRTVLP